MLIRIFLEKVFIVFQESFYSDFLFLSLLTQEREILWKSQNENFISRVHKSQFDFQIKIHNSRFKFNCDCVVFLSRFLYSLHGKLQTCWFLYFWLWLFYWGCVFVDCLFTDIARWMVTVRIKSLDLKKREKKIF